MDDILSSLMILERDSNGDVLMTWSHQISESSNLAKVAISRSHLSSPTIPQQFIFSKFQRNWIYIYTDSNKELCDKLKRVSVFSICLFTTSYNPEKFGFLCKILSNIYNKSGNPVELLDVWLKLVRNAPVEGFESNEFPDREAMIHTPIQVLSKLLDEELVLVWNAVMLKKRIIVFSEKMGLLLKFIRALPLFSFHRQDWDILRPYMTVDGVELEDMVNSGIYIAGFTDPAIKRKSKLWDVFIDLTERKVTISDSVVEQFQLSPFHQDIAQTLKKSEDEDVSNNEILKAIIEKTKALLAKLDSLKVKENEDDEGYITLESLQQRKIPQGLEKFLFGVATAEDITKS